MMRHKYGGPLIDSLVMYYSNVSNKVIEKLPIYTDYISEAMNVCTNRPAGCAILKRNYCVNNVQNSEIS